MKKYLIIIVTVFLLTGCNKDYILKCSGTITEDDIEYKINVTTHYDLDDHVKSIDYEMIYDNEDLFKRVCEESKDKNPKCENLTISYSENDEVTQSFTKNDVRNMLYVIGINECE